MAVRPDNEHIEHVRALQLPVFGMAVLWPHVLAGQPSAWSARVSTFLDLYAAAPIGESDAPQLSLAGGAPFTTSPSRLRGVDVNLLHVAATLQNDRSRVRLGLQLGSAVDRLQAGGSRGETNEILRYVREASVGTRVASAAWFDVGIHPSHAGVESWISSENLTYTRSLLADHVPIQALGARMTWRAASWLNAQVHALRGWDAVRDARGWGGGLRLAVAPTPAFALVGFNVLVERPDGRLRMLHGFGMRLAAGRLTAQMQGDIGSQENSSPYGRAAHWWGYALTGRAQLFASVALSTRFERFDDDKQIVLKTGEYNGSGNAPFRGYAESLGVDVTPRRGVLWRTEIRAFQNSGPAFPPTVSTQPRRNTAFAVTSLALSY